MRGYETKDKIIFHSKFCLLHCCISNSVRKWWYYVLLFPCFILQVISTGLSSRRLIQRVCLIMNLGSESVLTYLTLCHCWRIRHNAHQKQTTSLCKNQQETPPGTCGCHPWAGTLPCTLPMCGNTKGNLRRLAETSRKLHRGAACGRNAEMGLLAPPAGHWRTADKGGKEPTGRSCLLGWWVRTAVRAFTL